MKTGVIRATRLPNKRYDYNSEDVFRLFNKGVERKTYLYARVSTQKQKADFENQVAMLKQFCFSIGYRISGQKFINLHKTVPYRDLDKILKSDKGYPDYRAMPTAQSAKQVLQPLDKNWKSFLSSSKTGQKEAKDKIFRLLM